MNSSNLTFTFMISLAAIALFSCNIACNKKDQAQVIDHHTAEISLDWAGTYSGNLPCADCEYIETELTLTNDLTYVLITQYAGKDTQPALTKLEGKFTWEGNNVKLEGIPANERPAVFKVEENQVRQLDMEGKQIIGELAQHYVLHKNGNPTIEDKRWQLVELNGQAIKGAADTHYLIFHAEMGRLEAKVDCNMLLNDYKIKDELQVKIVPGISTLMACPDNLEQEFSEVLFLADNLSTDGKILTLNKGRMAPLARFELVKE